MLILPIIVKRRSQSMTTTTKGSRIVWLFTVGRGGICPVTSAN